MKVGILYNYFNNKFNPSSKKFIEILKYNNIETVFLDINKDSFWTQVKICDLFIYKWSHTDYGRQIARAIIPLFENQLGVKCFPSGTSNWLYDDKIRETYLLAYYHYPIAPSYIFYSAQRALDFAKQCNYPIVFKLKRGAGGSGVQLVKNFFEAEKLVRLMFGRGISRTSGMPGTILETINTNGWMRTLRKEAGRIKYRMLNREDSFAYNWGIEKNYVMFQDFYSNNDFDTRVVTIGERVFAFRRKNKKGSFKASGSQNVDYNPKHIDHRFLETALNISKELKFETMAYDFIYDNQGKPIIVEISYAFGGAEKSKIEACPGYWDQKMIWHKGSFAPEFYQLQDMLGYPNLKYPL
jgi:glutathione synthase/RimK-type ligase-like ATP-grasp enzyme